MTTKTKAKTATARRTNKVAPQPTPTAQPNPAPTSTPASTPEQAPSRPVFPIDLKVEVAGVLVYLHASGQLTYEDPYVPYKIASLIRTPEGQSPIDVQSLIFLWMVARFGQYMPPVPLSVPTQTTQPQQ